MKNKPKLPHHWNKDLAYFFGLLLGDGSLPKARSKRPNGRYQQRYIINFFSNSREFLEIIYIPLFNKLFGLFPNLEIRKKGRKNPVYNSRIESIIIYKFLDNLGFTIGRKARIAKIPSMPKKYYPSMLAGLLDTDGGKKGNGFGFSTASKNLAEFCIQEFSRYNLCFHSTPWHYKNHIYHQIYISKKNMHNLLKYVPLKNVDKVKFVKGAPVA